MNMRLLLPATAATLVLAIAGCGSGSSSGKSSAAKPAATPSKEVNPSGDIPDNQAYVPFNGPGFSLRVPEGWSRMSSGGATIFTDKLNSIRVVSRSGAPRPTLADARRTAPAGSTVSTVVRKGGTAVLVKYVSPGKPNPVTGKTAKDAVETYSFFRSGRQVVLTLSAPVTADNVDPWKLVSDSLRVK